MDNVFIEKLNESFIKIHTDDEGIKQTLSESFTFMVPNAWFMPMYKSGRWDGKIRLFNLRTSSTYLGLLYKVEKILQKYSIPYKLDPKFQIEKIDLEDIKKEIGLYKGNFDIRWYQHDLVLGALREQKFVGKCPTGSGKSFSIYLYIKFLLEHVLSKNEKVLLVVPRINLVLQMQSDFLAYNKNYGKIENMIHAITGGVKKDDNKQIYISTWQSIYDQDESYFHKFKSLIIDEVHEAKTDSIKKICENSINASWRLGVTGSLDSFVTHKNVITGLLGNIYEIVETKTLIEENVLAKLMVYNVVLKYPLDECRLIGGSYLNSDRDYQRELTYILSHEKRNKLISEFITKLNGNTLVVFNRIEYGRNLENILKQISNRPVYYIDGSITAIEREKIRRQIETSVNCIVVASIQIFGMGVNIIELTNVVCPIPIKTQIRLLQLIGRGLRKSDTKQNMNFVEFTDDLTFVFNNPKKTCHNIAYEHGKERLKIYKKEGFPVVTKTIRLEKYNNGG